MTARSPQTPVHGEVIEIRPQVAHAQVAPVDPLPAYYTPDTLIADLMDELRDAKERIALLTAANRALSKGSDGLRTDGCYPSRADVDAAMIQRGEHRLVSAAREALAMVKSGGASHD